MDDILPVVNTALNLATIAGLIIVWKKFKGTADAAEELGCFRRWVEKILGVPADSTITYKERLSGEHREQR